MSPLTGLPLAAPEPVVAVKIDNVGVYGENGLNAADVVYCEEVEGGLTRLLAVFSSHPPLIAGPVRSARESDLELLGEYGRVALAFSGANAGVLAEVRGANLVDDSYDTQTGSYSFDDDRPAPYRFLAHVAELAASHPGAVSKDVGFRFGAAPAEPASTPAVAGTTVTVRYPGAVITATYSGGGYTISRNGSVLMTDGVPTTATNVLLQYVSVHTTDFVDHNGNPTPFSVTVGSGQAEVLRAGLAYPGTWSRATMTAATTWRTAAGASLTLAPGRTWVLLVPIGSPVSVG